MTFTFYILYSAAFDKYYFGFTGDVIEERIRKHNSNHKGFTGVAGDWVLKYCEVFQIKNEGYKREWEIKSWKSRKLIQELIVSDL